MPVVDVPVCRSEFMFTGARSDLLPGFKLSSFRSIGRGFPCPAVHQPTTSVTLSAVHMFHWDPPPHRYHFEVFFPALEAPFGSSARLCPRTMLLPLLILFFCTNEIACTATQCFCVSHYVCVYWALSGSCLVPSRVVVVAGPPIHFVCDCLCSHSCAAFPWKLAM